MSYLSVYQQMALTGQLWHLCMMLQLLVTDFTSCLTAPPIPPHTDSEKRKKKTTGNELSKKPRHIRAAHLVDVDVWCIGFLWIHIQITELNFSGEIGEERTKALWEHLPLACWMRPKSATLKVKQIFTCTLLQIWTLLWTSQIWILHKEQSKWMERK